MNSKYWNLSLTLIISLLIFLVFTLIQSLVLIIIKPENIDSTNLAYETLAYSNLGTISSISSLFGIAGILIFIYIKKTSFSEYLNLYFPKIEIIIVFVFLSFIMMFLMEYLSRFFPVLFETDFVVESYKQARSLPIFYIGVVFFGPIFEEFLFRGFLFKGLENSFFGGHGAVFLSALIFSLVHIQYGLPIIICMLFPMATLLGYARLKSNSLLLPILLHCLNNLLTCIVTHFEVY